MSSLTVQFYLFSIASTILIVGTLVAMILHYYLDGYSLKYERMSYCGKRQDFVHPIRGTQYYQNSYPEILNYSILIPGVLYMVGFLRVNDLGLKILGVLFSFIILLVGAVDVSSHYHLHNGAVIISQPVFLILNLYIILSNFTWISLVVFVAIFILILINVYQKQIQNRQPDLRVNVIPQKLFIYIEAAYFIYMAKFIL